jgi:hypothetical protein
MTRITRTIVTAGLALGLAAPALAQTKPDFSGHWTLDTEKSDPMRGPGGGGPMGGGPRGPVTLKVTQTATDLTIERSMGDRTMKTVYKLDGSEAVNQGPRGGEQRSKSRWDGTSLVTESVQPMSTPGGDFTLEARETRTLQDDGTMLVVTVTRSPRGENTRKTVFRKS